MDPPKWVFKQSFTSGSSSEKEKSLMRENNKIKKFLKEILKDLDELKAADIVTIDIKTEVR